MRSTLALAIVCTLAPAFAQDAKASVAAQAVSIRLLTEGKKVIPLVHAYQDPSLVVTHVKLPEVVIANEGAETVSLRQLELVGRRSGKEVIRQVLDEQTLASGLATYGPGLKKVFETRGGSDSLKVQFGVTRLDASRLTTILRMDKGQMVFLPLPFLRSLEFTGEGRLEELVIECAYQTGASVHRVSLCLPLPESKCKGSYTFPLKPERLFLVNLPMNLGTHRQCHSQEFAFDAISVVADEAGGFRSRTAAKPKKLEDYPVYGRDVLAIGEGIVVEAANGFPVEENADPSAYSEATFTASLKRLVPRIGFKNAVSGNYVVVDHGNGEYSFYAHLGELKKKAGDRVSRGEILGTVGNTGHSTEPHLHFHLMDGPDLLTANGLPVMFGDVKADALNGSLKEANALFASDALLLPMH